MAVFQALTGKARSGLFIVDRQKSPILSAFPADIQGGKYISPSAFFLEKITRDCYEGRNCSLLIVKKAQF